MSFITKIILTAAVLTEVKSEIAFLTERFSKLVLLFIIIQIN